MNYKISTSFTPTSSQPKIHFLQIYNSEIPKTRGEYNGSSDYKKANLQEPNTEIN